MEGGNSVPDTFSVPTLLRMTSPLSRLLLEARCLLQGSSKGQWVAASKSSVRVLLEALSSGVSLALPLLP